jgi:hypothetical protein
MKLKSFVGIDIGPVMVIERSTDLYPALDVIQTRMIELMEQMQEEVQLLKGRNGALYERRRKNLLSEINKLDKCIKFISIGMKQTEKAGFGSQSDVENIEY